jgi:hypothetical protein
MCLTCVKALPCSDTLVVVSASCKENHEPPTVNMTPKLVCHIHINIRLRILLEIWTEHKAVLQKSPHLATSSRDVLRLHVIFLWIVLSFDCRACISKRKSFKRDEESLSTRITGIFQEVSKETGVCLRAQEVPVQLFPQEVTLILNLVILYYEHVSHIRSFYWVNSDQKLFCLTIYKQPITHASFLTSIPFRGKKCH